MSYTRVSKLNPCPVCKKADWCRVFADGWVECMRVQSDRPAKSGGWMHSQGQLPISASPPLGKIPPTWVATDCAGLLFFNRFAARLAKSPPDMVTHLGMVRANAYFDAGCPLELCDHAAARDVWRVMHQVAIAPCRSGQHEEVLCR